MNRALVLWANRPPAWIRKRALWALFGATARAFDRPTPSLAGLSADECLLCYAQFTRGQVTERLLDGDNLPAVQERLYRNAHALGRVCRRVFGASTLEDAMVVGRVLYRLLDIEFQGGEEGVLISRCSFSRFYSGPTCRVMSAMDRGLFAGLSGDRQLFFTARITEGQAHCRAQWTAEGDKPR